MFNNSSANKLEVTVVLADGSTVSGAINAGLSAGLLAAINKEVPFIELTEASGTKRCIGLAHIMSVEEAKPFRQPKALQATTANAQNAFAMMRLSPECTAEDAQRRYHEMVKQYHPDKYQSVDLPPEISDYLSQTFHQLSTAYKIVTQTILNQRAA